ncbi:MAG: metal ABC transporter substrate-binding protein [Oligoflexia bacterium]|nr:metal ABC transporter substrate-binding protein [Oligoflexia bacterium]
MKIIASTLFLVLVSISVSAEPLKIVTTMPTFASIAKEIGGELVEVSAVASPRFNPHFIEAKPSDVLRLKRCDLFIHAGLDLEAWRQPLVDASARADLRSGAERALDLSEFVTILNVPHAPISRSQGDIHMFGNPHYWLSPQNGLAIARAIGAKLAGLDPQHVTSFKTGEGKFLANLQQLMTGWQELSSGLRSKEVIAYHDEWPYLLDYLGIRSERFIEPKPGIPPSPQFLGELRDYIRTREVRLLVQASYYDQDAIMSLSNDTGAQVAFLCQNVGERSECGSYGAMLDYNIRTIVDGLSDSRVH